MDLASTIDNAVTYFPETLGLSGVLLGTTYYVPAQLDFFTIFQFLLFLSAAVLLLSTLGRFILGQHSSLNHSVSCSMAIIFIYALIIIVYIIEPWTLDNLSSPLPFVTFNRDYLILFQFDQTNLLAFSQQAVSLILLSFLINFLDCYIPHGESSGGWLLLRLMSVVLAVVLHLILNWVLRSFLPAFLTDYGPAVILILGFSMILLGFLNGILGLFLTSVNPVIGCLYTFFFSNAIGKQITKALFSAAIIIVILFLLDHMGYTVISISASSMIGYVPLLVLSLILWYLVGYLL